MSPVRLRCVIPDDADWIFDACQDIEIQRWTQVPRPYTRDHARQFVSDSTSEYARWAIEATEFEQPVGLISIHEIEGSTASIGYWMIPRFRGKGFVVAAIQLVCEDVEQRVLRSEADADVVIATIARDNGASRRAVEKAGFALAREQDGPAVDGLVPVRTCVYAKRLTASSP